MAKKNHHMLPRLYLRGFAINGDEGHLWEYRREGEYKPGKGRQSSNPFRQSSRDATVEVGAYALPTDTGELDFDTYENKLEKMEKPHDDLLRKVRRHEPLTPEEKVLFVSYILMMVKRVSARKKRTKKQWEELMNSDYWRIAKEGVEKVVGPIEQKHGKEIADAVRAGLLRQAAEREEQYRAEGMPLDMQLDTMLMDMEQSREALERMTWRYLRAPEGVFFVTSDNPVWAVGGLERPNGEVIFPISSSICLHASWDALDADSFIDVNAATVAKVNGLIMDIAVDHVFAEAASEAIHADFVNRRSP